MKSVKILLSVLLIISPIFGESISHVRGQSYFFSLEVCAAPQDITRVEFIAPYLAEIGIEVIVNVAEWHLKESLMLTSREPSYEGGWDVIFDAEAIPSDPDRTLIYHSMNVAPEGVGNSAGYNNGQVDRLFEQQIEETNFTKRMEIISEIQRILYDDLPTIIMVQGGIVELWNNKIPIAAAEKVTAHTGTGMTNPPFQIAKYMDPIPGKDTFYEGYHIDRRGYLTIWGWGYFTKAHSGNLIHNNPQGGQDPELAESWDVSDDGLLYTFHLRDGAYWSDGVQFTSADAKFTLECILDPDAGARYGSDFSAVVDHVETPDPLTLEIYLKKRYMPFLSILGYKYGVQMLPYHILKDIPTSEFTTCIYNTEVGAMPALGPWKCVETKLGEYAKWEAYNQSIYWTEIFKKDPPFKYYVQKIIPDSTTNLAALEADELDWIGGFAGPWDTMYKDLLESTEFNALSTPYMNFEHFILNLDHPVLTNVHVRRAMAYAIPHQEYYEKMTSELGRPTSVMWPMEQTASEYREPYLYDLEKAKEEMRLAGYDLSLVLPQQYQLPLVEVAISVVAGIVIGAGSLMVLQRRKPE